MGPQAEGRTVCEQEDESLAAGCLQQIKNEPSLKVSVYHQGEEMLNLSQELGLPRNPHLLSAGCPTTQGEAWQESGARPEQSRQHMGM